MNRQIINRDQKYSVYKCKDLSNFHLVSKKFVYRCYTGVPEVAIITCEARFRIYNIILWPFSDRNLHARMSSRSPTTLQENRRTFLHFFSPTPPPLQYNIIRRLYFFYTYNILVFGERMKTFPKDLLRRRLCLFFWTFGRNFSAHIFAISWKVLIHSPHRPLSFRSVWETKNWIIYNTNMVVLYIVFLIAD